MPPPQQPGPKPRNAYGRLKHKKDLEAFARELSTAVNQCLPSYDKPYGQVAVLAFHWENDDIGVEPLETELLSVFRNIYAYNVESYTIPATHTAAADLTLKLGQFTTKWAAEDALRIYVYSGHAEEADAAGLHHDLGGRTDHRGNILGPKVNWYRSRYVSETAAGDVLYIMDTCFSASAALYDGPELLAAASWTDVAGASLATSFTQMLINELKALKGAPSAVSQIYCSIHREALSSGLARGPVHIPRKGHESLVLAKLAGGERRKPESHETRRARITSFSSSENRVLISVNLADDIRVPDVEQWKRWLTTNTPSRVMSTDVTIEAAFRGSSSVLLVTLPVELWTMLPADEEAYSFISFVKSNNLLPSLTPATSSPLV